MVTWRRALVGPMVAAAWLGLLAGSQAADPPPRPTLRVVSFNIRHGTVRNTPTANR